MNRLCEGATTQRDLQALGNNGRTIAADDADGNLDHDGRKCEPGDNCEQCTAIGHIDPRGNDAR